MDLAACGLRTCADSTPLSSTPFRLFSPVPPLPALLLPLLSLKSVTPHCLFILFGTLSSFHLLFLFYFIFLLLLLLLLLPDKVGLSRFMCLAFVLFYYLKKESYTWWLDIITTKIWGGGGVSISQWVCMTCSGSCGLVLFVCGCVCVCVCDKTKLKRY